MTALSGRIADSPLVLMANSLPGPATAFCKSLEMVAREMDPLSPGSFGGLSRK